MSNDLRVFVAGEVTNIDMAKYIYGTNYMPENGAQWEVGRAVNIALVALRKRSQIRELFKLALAEMQAQCTACTVAKTCDDCKWPGC